jgi:type IV secretion system protein VirB3
LNKHAPLHRSLTEPILLAGVPREPAIVLWIACLALGVGLRTWYALPAGAILHSIFYYLARYDNLFMETFRRHFRYNSHMSP